ncbi:sulfotransferase 6B1-like [Eleutherodactylus coqui]
MDNIPQFHEEMKKILDSVKNVPKEALVFTYNGVMYPAAICDTDTFKDIESFEAREDDLMLVSYPKCGSHWAHSLLHSIVGAKEKKEAPFGIPVIEFKVYHKYVKENTVSSPRILATHLHYHNIPQSFFDKKVKMLVVFRNPKDTAVSFFHFYNNNSVLPSYDTWDDFFPDFMAGKVVNGSYFDHAVTWNKHLDEDTVLLMTFEDMKEDLEGSVKKISEFFGISITEEQVKQIAEKGSFKYMKENSEKTQGAIAKVVFRKGDVGDWRSHFSEAQSQEVDSKFEE